MVEELKRLSFVDASHGNNYPDRIVVVAGPDNSQWFEEESEGNYVAMFQNFDTLTHDEEAKEYVWTQPNGQRMVFHDNSASIAETLTGRIKALVDRAGRTVLPSYNEDGHIASLEQQVDGQSSVFTYEYNTGAGSLTGLLNTVTLSVNGSPVRRSRYGYYSGESGGTGGDLKSAVVEQYVRATTSWETIEQRHYRYYVVGDSNGFVHGLKLAIRGVAYQQMVAAGLDPETATETELRTFANFYFEYDTKHRAVREETEGGRNIYQLLYEENPDFPVLEAVNRWTSRTTEMLPDGSQNRVYCNGAGQTILSILQKSDSGDQWYRFTEYNESYQVTTQANSAAVASVVEPVLPASSSSSMSSSGSSRSSAHSSASSTISSGSSNSSVSSSLSSSSSGSSSSSSGSSSSSPSMLSSSSGSSSSHSSSGSSHSSSSHSSPSSSTSSHNPYGLTVNLNPDSGLLNDYSYYTETNPDEGAVEGRFKKATVKKGTDGAPTAVRSVGYTAHTAFGQTIYPLQTLDVFSEYTTDDPTRTTYEYVWLLDGEGNPTLQMQQRTTTYSAVPEEQNGSGIAGVEEQIFDNVGRLIWHKDTRGAITYQAYDPVTGALVQRIDDVDTAQMSDVPEGWVTVPGWGLNLITDYVNDSQGRVLQALGPWHEVQLQEKDTTATSIRRVQFTAYLDAAHEVRRATGYLTGGGDLAAYTVVGAVSITRSNASGQTVDDIQAVRTCNCGALTASEPFPQSAWSRWTHYIYDTWGRLSSQRVYWKIPLRGEGQAGANYLETLYGYDIMGRRNRLIEPSGTIRRTVYDVRGLVVSNWVGTEDRDATDDNPSGDGAPGNNMVMVSANEYDEGEAGGPGNLTKVTNLVDADSTNDRVVTFGYDYRNRRDTTTTTDGVTTWITKTSYDNQNRPVENTKYQSTVADANRIARSRILYDLLGRVYRQETDGVDPSNGSITNTLSAQNWYDLGGNTIKKSPTGSTSFTKTVFDALNRPTVTYTACVPGTAGVPVGDDNDVSDDTVLEQNGTVYDRGGNVIQSNRSQRFDDAIGTGALQNVNTQPKARVSSVAIWPDGVGRVRNTADYGTDGGAPLERPPVAPLRSDTVLVTTNRFKDDGEANATIDPMGLETRWDNDQMGRRIRLIENYVPGCEDRSRISEYVYHPSGQLQRLTLQNSQTGDQVTEWIFGTTLFDSAIADNNLLRAKIYPESDDRPAPPSDGPDGVYCRLEYALNRQGQMATFTDADGTVHAYSYDKLGRQIADAVTVLGPDLDDTVLRIERAYETRGMLATVTSYDAASAGAIVNQVVMVYDAFGNLTADKQSHSGAVTGGTPVVAYSYADGSANTVRRTAITYPNGKVLNFLYGNANSIDDHFNRVTALRFAGDTASLVEYTYVGVAWQIRVGYPGPDVELTYKHQGDEPIGDAGDPYNGYDRFGRTQDIWWRTIE